MQVDVVAFRSALHHRYRRTRARHWRGFDQSTLIPQNALGRM